MWTNNFLKQLTYIADVIIHIAKRNKHSQKFNFMLFLAEF
jgi:hypothetical protein